MSTKSQRLVGSSVSPDVAENLSAPVRDALWFAARQWQFGEFAAENGGTPVAAIIHQTVEPLLTASIGETSVALNPDTPLEAVLEPEESGGWSSERLGYDARLASASLEFALRGYDGRELDWHDFALRARLDWTQTKPEPLTVVPGMLGFPGAPDPRWWEIEDGAAYFDSAIDPEPNVLSMLLPEFFYTDIANWFLLPAPVPSGSVRRIHKVEMVDSFGVVTEVDAAGDDRFGLFGIEGTGPGDREADPGLMLAPNVAVRVVDGDILEETHFLRDEATNLVWAHEQVVTDPDTGRTYETGTERGGDAAESDGPGTYFRLKSDAARAFIPYLPRNRADATGAVEPLLRRGRTDASAGPDAPQYRGQVLSESRWLAEESVAPGGTRVRRIQRFARGADGEEHFWTARDRDRSPSRRRPGLRFDHLDDQD